ncbi:MAG: GNAT family N-acetyltransferase [Syntrophomonadaceae bacterium]|nr:GNAT family N-acetyltransferase [Syntrophomonadaceae bacterium]
MISLIRESLTEKGGIGLGEKARLDDLKQMYPEKFTTEYRVFKNIKRGNKVFFGTGVGEPRYLVRALMEYLDKNPAAFFDVDIYYVWTLQEETDFYEKYKNNFRINSFFIGDPNRDAINQGLADYTPVFTSKIPKLFNRKAFPIDIALIQTSLPDEHGYFNLGVNVDIVKAAVENASLIIVQPNSYMPNVHGDGFIHVNDIDYIVPHDEPLPEYAPAKEGEIELQIGSYVARLIQDGDTIQVGYGSIPAAVLSCLSNKKHLGVHSELLTDEIVDLMKIGVIDNTQKSLNKGKTIGSFCLGKRETYDFFNNNPAVELRRLDYVSDLMNIASHNNMTAVNSVLQIDLTGQATAESLGNVYYSGITGFANFMRATLLAKRGKTIIALKSTAKNGEVSKIVPNLLEGSGVSVHRADVQYVVTEYGIAYLQGKNLRERAMELISIAHPKFRPWLIEEAKARNLIYKDQKFIPGSRGKYLVEYETYKTTKTGLDILLRPIKISDEPRLREFFNSLSDNSLFTRFFSPLPYVTHESIQDIISVDNAKGVSILAVVPDEENQIVIGMGQYSMNDTDYSAEVSFATSDNYQNNGISSILLNHLTYLALKNGIQSFTASVLMQNGSMIHVLKKAGFAHKSTSDGVFEFEKILRM